MVRVKLLGPLRSHMGKDELSLDSRHNKVKDILAYLSTIDNSDESIEYNVGNTLVIVNGIDSSAIEGPETSLRQDDEVVVIPAVHGGLGGPTENSRFRQTA